MRPCIICRREKCDGFYYEIWEGGYCHYRFADRNCSIGKDFESFTGTKQMVMSRLSR